MTKATITLADAAPAEKLRFVFAHAEFTLVGKQKYETNDPEMISDAEAHAWLDVKHAAVDVIQGSYREQIAAEDDALAALGPHVDANDPEVARQAELDKGADQAFDVAIEVSENQKTVVVEDGAIAKTLAADPTSKTSTNVKDKD